MQTPIKHLGWGAVLALLALAAWQGMALAQAAHYTGIVGDDMCGVQHNMDPGHSAAACVHMCIGEGASYDLIVGKHWYRLVTKDKQLLAVLSRYAAKKVTVAGVKSGKDIKLTAVRPSA